MISEQERAAALIASNNTCARCGNVAWSRQLKAAMELRQKRSNPDRKELVCAECCTKQDAKKASKRRRAA